MVLPSGEELFGTHPCTLHVDCPCPLLVLQVVLSSDEEVFGGWKNVTKDSNVEFQTQVGRGVVWWGWVGGLNCGGPVPSC